MEADVQASVDAYIVGTTTTPFLFDDDYQIDLAGAVSSHEWAKANAASKDTIDHQSCAGVRSAILLAQPEQSCVSRRLPLTRSSMRHFARFALPTYAAASQPRGSADRALARRGWTLLCRSEAGVFSRLREGGCATDRRQHGSGFRARSWQTWGASAESGRYERSALTIVLQAPRFDSDGTSDTQVVAMRHPGFRRAARRRIGCGDGAPTLCTRLGPAGRGRPKQPLGACAPAQAWRLGGHPCLAVPGAVTT